jgi:hypothetical protein
MEKSFNKPENADIDNKLRKTVYETIIEKQHDNEVK